MKKFLYVILGVLFLSSCRSNLYVLPSLPPETSVADSIRLVDTEITSSKAGSGYRGISRVRTYKFSHPDVPAAFDGFRIAFISDLHYKSLFKEKGLENWSACSMTSGQTCYWWVAMRTRDVSMWRPSSPPWRR